jgi:hypothetical protein
MLCLHSSCLHQVLNRTEPETTHGPISCFYFGFECPVHSIPIYVFNRKITSVNVARVGCGAVQLADANSGTRIFSVLSAVGVPRETNL